MSGPDLVVLNVGGRLFHTTRTTLTKHPESMLAGMFRGDLPSGLVCDGGHFIDRDPLHFASILTFLRDGHVPLPDSPLERQQLRAEAAFYSLTELAAAIDEAEAARHEAEAAAAAERAQREDAVRARDLLDVHRAEIMKSALAIVAREGQAEQQARQRFEAAQAGLQQWEAAEQHAAEQLGGLAPGVPEAVALRQQLAQHRRQMQQVAEAVREARERMAKAARKLRAAQLAQLCAAGLDYRAAEAMLAAAGRDGDELLLGQRLARRGGDRRE